jgi:hypothetical protein
VFGQCALPSPRLRSDHKNSVGQHQGDGTNDGCAWLFVSAIEALTTILPLFTTSIGARPGTVGLAAPFNANGFWRR